MTKQHKKLDFSCTSDDFKVAVRGYGVKVEIDPDGNATVYSNRPARLLPPEMATGASVEALKIGATMLDGSLFAGVSPDTGKPMYTTQNDAPLTFNFNQAADRAANLDVHSHKDWRVPTKDELNVLFGNRAAIGGFNTTGSNPSGWYWSSSRGYNYLLAWAQRFSDGYQVNGSRNDTSALRCVRG